MKHIVSFSGGKDSTAMLLMMIEKKWPIDEIVCVDTTKEFPEMYRHIEKVKNKINPLKITILSVRFDYYFKEHIKLKGTGKYKDKKGYGWPDFRMRWCTDLKKTAIRRHLKGIKYIDYRGIAVDEQKRLLKNKDKKNIVYPLAEWGITEKMALDYCYEKGFNWEGLYEKFNRVSCFCCPLQRIGELKTIYCEFPELWGIIKKMDKSSFRTFKPTYSLEELEKRFANEISQQQFFRK